MPGKHVRFATIPTLQTTPPSPSHSSHSSNSYHHGSPRSSSYHYQDDDPYRHYTSTSHSRVLQIHRYLAYSHPRVSFDVRFPSSTITSSHSHSNVPSRTLSEPAISPPVASLTLSIPHLSPHWRITVTPSNGVFITLADVFNAVYYTLRTRISESEYRAIRSVGDLKRVNEAYRERYRKVGRHGGKYAEEVEKKGGVRRVDFLTGHTKFEGISVMEDGRTFVLHLS